MTQSLKILLVSLSFGLALGTSVIVWWDIPNGTIASKIIYFNGAIAIVGGLVTVYGWLGQRRWQWHLNSTDRWVAGYFLYILLHWLISSAALNDRFLAQMLLLAVYGLTKQVFAGPDNGWPQSIALTLFLLTGLYQGVYGWLQLYGYYPSLHPLFKVTGSFHNPGPYAIFLSTYLPFALGIYFFHAVENAFDRFIKQVCLVVILVIFLLLPATHARTAWLAATGGGMVLLWLKTDWPSGMSAFLNTRFKKIIILSLAGSLLAIGLVALYQFKRDSAFGRLLIWKISGKIIADHPLFGHGFGSFEKQYNHHQAAYFAKQTRPAAEIKVAGKVEYAFNDWLQITVEYGLVGSLLFLLLLSSAFTRVTFRQARGQPSNRASALVAALAALVALIIAGFSSYPLEVLPIQITFFFLLAVVSARLPNRTYAVQLRLGPRMLLSLLVITTSGWLFFRQQRVYQAQQEWFTADTQLMNGQYEAALKGYEKVYPTLKYEANLLLGYGKTLSLTGHYRQSVTVLNQAGQLTADPFLYSNLGESYQALKAYAAAEAAYQRAACMVPNRLYPRYQLAQLYLAKGDTLAAAQTARLLLAMPEKVPSLAAQEMKQAMRQLLQQLEQPSRELPAGKGR